MIDAGTVAAYLTLDTTDFADNIAVAGQTLTAFRQEQSDGFRGLSGLVGGLGRTLLEKWEGAVGSLGNSAALGRLPARLRERGAAAMNGLTGGLLSRREAAAGALKSTVEFMRGAAGGVSFVPIGQQVVSGILAGMNGRRASLMTAARSLATGVSSVIRAALKIQSPSRVMMEIGEMTAKGMALGLNSGAVQVFDTASLMSKETAEVLAGVAPPVMAGGGSGFTMERDRLERLIDAVERLAAASPTVEIDGRPFGRLVREYV